MEHLKLVTHNVPAVVREPLVALIGQECYTTLVFNLDFTSSSCLKYSISKVLGLVIVAGGSIVKVPQILKIVGGKSARGLSLSSYVLDTAGLAITVAYNFRHGFPWSTYGESVFLLVQNVVITFLIITFSSSNSRTLLLGGLTTASALATYALTSPALSLATLQFLAALCIPLSLFSKLPQILSNFSAGSTGQLSAFLVFNSLAGCLARVFTTATETADPVLWWGFVLAASLNAIIAAQMAMYWKGEQPKETLTKGARKETFVHVPIEEVKVEARSLSPAVAGKATAKSSSPITTPKRYVRKLD